MNEAKRTSQPTRMADSTLVSLVALLDVAVPCLLLCLLIWSPIPLTERGFMAWTYIQVIIEHCFVNAVIGVAILGGVLLYLGPKPRFVAGGGLRLVAVSFVGWIAFVALFFLLVDWYMRSDASYAEELALGPGTIAGMWVVRVAAIKFMNRGGRTQAVATQGTLTESS